LPVLLVRVPQPQPLICMDIKPGVASRSLHSSKPALSPSPSENTPTSTTSAITPITSIAKQGSNQLSLEQPRNRAGASNVASISSWIASLPTYPEYVLSTLDKVVNWARQGSMWPMTFGALPHPRGYTAVLKHCRTGLLCRGDDAYGSCTV